LRRVAADLLITLGVVALGLGAIVSVARRALFYPDAFAERLTASLSDSRVASFVADRMAAAVVKQDPDLTAFRPLIAATARGAVSSSSFQALVRATARTTHASLFSEGGRTVIVSVPDVGVLLRSALARANPAMAAKVPPRLQGVLAAIGQSQFDRAVLRLWNVSLRSQWLAGILGFGGALVALAGVVLARNPRHAISRLGLDLLAAAVVLLLLRPGGRAIVAALPHDDLARKAAAGLWDTFTGSLRTWALVLGGIGLVLQAAGHSLLGRFDVPEAARSVIAWLDQTPATASGRLLRAFLAVAAGAFAVLQPTRAASLVAMLVGGLLAFVGIREIFEMTLRALPEPSPPPGQEQGDVARRTGWRAGLVLGLAALFAAAIAWIGRPAAASPPVTSDACNGAPELCARRLDEVVFPGTHNSMSAADVPDWLFPQQERGIAGQLDDGVRALLVDVHYGIPVEGRVKTDIDSEGTSREKLEQAVGREGVDAAMRIRDRFAGKAEGPRGLYLCHGFCELGAIPFARALTELHEFLVQSPDEVVVLVVEDYVSPQDLAGAFAESGLDGLVYRGAAAAPWPTLREMIDARERVLVLTESGRPGIPWIHPAFDVMQETPFRFNQPSDMSCAANRGGTSGSLFLMNNWIDTTPAPKPSNAAIVNAYDALLARAKRCQAERGRRPTVIAVDFYRTGALFRVARQVNGLVDAAPN
jgi:ethanolamine utilization microcompartment shell protein EutS